MTDKDFLSELELSVRATNVLRAAGITTMPQFMALTPEAVRLLRNAGRRTAQEVTEMQASLNGDAAKRALAEQTTEALTDAVNTLNRWMVQKQRTHRFVVDPDGLIQIFRRVL